MKYTRKTMHFGAEASTYRNAYHLRKNPTRAEAILWSHLRKYQMEGIRFRQQHPMVNYVADFYAHTIKLVIEVDGKYHEDETVSASDAIRDNIMKELSITVLRLTNEEVINDIEQTLQKIRQVVLELLKKKFRAHH